MHTVSMLIFWSSTCSRGSSGRAGAVAGSAGHMISGQAPAAEAVAVCGHNISRGSSPHGQVGGPAEAVADLRTFGSPVR